VGQKLADIFTSGGDVQFYLLGGSGTEASSSTSGLDIGAVPGSKVVAPISGKITAVKSYQILGRYPDTEIDIQAADDPSLLLVITHVRDAAVKIGDAVSQGTSVIGSLRGFPGGLEQQLSQYTSDSGDHLQLVALRVTAGLAGL
jgi:murein DD-endopeptidase MepM/ murein hydrolase activator NlpD